MDSIEVATESVRCDLEAPARSVVQFLRESERVGLGSPSKVPSQNQFARAFDSDEAVGVAALGVVRLLALFLAPDKSPHLITLNVRHRQATNLGLQEALAFLAN